MVEGHVDSNERSSCSCHSPEYPRFVRSNARNGCCYYCEKVTLKNERSEYLRAHDTALVATLFLVNRVLLLCMLRRQVVEEVPLRDMAARMDIARGALQGLQKDASVFCGMVVCFCRHLQWHELANVLFSFQV